MRRAFANRVKGHKYGAKPTVVDGIRFASKLEAKRYAELLLLMQAGHVRELELQPAFDLQVCGRSLGEYHADFEYGQLRGDRWHRVIEDVKGFDVPLQRWKRKHAEAQYGITVTLYPPRTKARAKRRRAVATHSRNSRVVATAARDVPQ